MSQTMWECDSLFHTDAMANESDLCNVALTKIELVKDESIDDIDDQLKL